MPVEPLRLSFEELWTKLERGHCAVLDGNPGRVADRSSPLRSMQGSDDYDHVVFVHTAGKDRALVMDPLGRGSYGDRWVPRVELRQYASRFLTASGSPYCAVVKRGEQSSVERLRRQQREQTRSLRAELATAKTAIATTRAKALRDAVKAIAAMPR